MSNSRGKVLKKSRTLLITKKNQKSQKNSKIQKKKSKNHRENQKINKKNQKIITKSQKNKKITYTFLEYFSPRTERLAS